MSVSAGVSHVVLKEGKHPQVLTGILGVDEDRAPLEEFPVLLQDEVDERAEQRMPRRYQFGQGFA